MESSDNSCFDLFESYDEGLERNIGVDLGRSANQNTRSSLTPPYLQDHDYCKVLLRGDGEETIFSGFNSFGFGCLPLECSIGEIGDYDFLESFLEIGKGRSFKKAPGSCGNEVSTSTSVAGSDEDLKSASSGSDDVEPGSKRRTFSRRIRKPKDWWTCAHWRTDVLKYRKTLSLRHSKIESNGVFSTGKIPAGTCIVEYLGERIHSKMADERERQYVSQGIVHDYMFRVNEELTIDATKKGSNISKYINHSCEPNACSKVVENDGRPRIVIVTLKDIHPNEEITYDYSFPIEENPDNRVKCLCGAASCRGFIN